MPKDTPEFVWVVVGSALQPAIERYRLLEIMATGYRVDMRGSPTIIRKANGRNFFTSEESLCKFLTSWVTMAMSNAESQVNSCRKLLTGYVSDGLKAFDVYEVPDKEQTEKIKSRKKMPKVIDAANTDTSLSVSPAACGSDVEDAYGDIDYKFDCGGGSVG